MSEWYWPHRTEKTGQISSWSSVPTSLFFLPCLVIGKSQWTLQRATVHNAVLGTLFCVIPNVYLLTFILSFSSPVLIG